MLSSTPTWAAGETLRDIIKNPVVWLGTAVLFLLIITFFVVKNALDTMKEISLKAQGRWEEVKEKQSQESTIMQSLTAAVPVERENEILTDHDYDGIQELDNRLPPWWLYGFYISIIFAVVYLVRFHITGDGLDSHEELAAEYAAWDAQQEAARGGAPKVELDPSTITALDDAASLAAGEAIFQANCAVCHLPDGGGQTGPNLTDEFWIHGGGITNVYTTIYDGAAGTAMAPWRRLGDEKVHKLASYVLSLQGTTPANPKAAEGDLWVEPTPTEEPVIEE